MFETILTFLEQFWRILWEMAPYLLFGFFVAGMLSVIISPAFVERHLGGRGIVQVFKAAIFGIPLPLCSCGVIPVAASLRRHGAGRGATTGFLLSTPQTGIDSILVTFSLLGLTFAIFRPLAALACGMIGGMLVTVLEPRNGEEPIAEQVCTDACCSPEKNRNRFLGGLHYGFVTLPRDIGRSLFIGLVLAGLISAAVPNDFFADRLGTGIVPMLVMMALGIPIYVCATASVPIAAALIAAGVSPGAALVFLMTGPATNAATVATIWKIMGRRTAVIYMATVAFSALGAGLTLDYIFGATGGATMHEMHEMLPEFVNTISAIILLGLLGYTVFFPYRKKEYAHEHAQSATLSITGMDCSHCAESVERELLACPGVEHVAVDLKGNSAVVSGDDYDLAELCRAVEGLGYKANVRE